MAGTRIAIIEYFDVAVGVMVPPVLFVKYTPAVPATAVGAAFIETPLMAAPADGIISS